MPDTSPIAPGTVQSQSPFLLLRLGNETIGEAAPTAWPVSFTGSAIEAIRPGDVDQLNVVYEDKRYVNYPTPELPGGDEWDEEVNDIERVSVNEDFSIVIRYS